MIILGLFLIILLIFVSIRPSNIRDWQENVKILPYAEINDNLVTLYNIRNASYTSKENYDLHYYDKTFNLDDLDSLDFIYVPFSDSKALAHTFFSFGFNGSYVAISIEVRKENGEKYSAFRGLFKKYEIIYVLGDEMDLIKLRSNY